MIRVSKVTFSRHFVEFEHVFVNRYGIINFIMPRATISRCFLFLLMIRLDLLTTDLKRVERSSPAELADF